MEFGVFRGDTINIAADYRKHYCEINPPPIFGFDTFEGLPETWDARFEKVGQHHTCISYAYLSLTDPHRMRDPQQQSS